MTLISASLLSCKDNLEEVTKEFNELDIDLIHLDIMDGEFVPYHSFSYDEIKKIVNNTNKPFDVHLMVKNPEKYIYDYAMLNTKFITIHYEAMNDIKVLEKIRSYGVRCGISIKPDTDVEEIYDILPLLDLVLIMSVEPGKGGQEFMPMALEKIKKLDEKIKSLGLNVLISVDGGINNNSATKCRNSGVDMLVIGSALVNSNDRVAFLEKCKQ